MEYDLDDKNVNNKNGAYIFIISLFLLSGFILSNLLFQGKANGASKIKTILSKQGKIPIRPWAQLLSRNNGREISNSKGVPEIPIPDQSTEDLATYINMHMSNLDRQDLPKIEKNIEAANTIISRVPDSYSAYKAKLISLLVKEAKFNQVVDDYEIDSLLESMASFDVSRDTRTLREAILLSDRNSEMAQIQEKLSDLDLRIEQNKLEYEAIDINSVEASQLEAEQARLMDEEQELFEIIVTLERNANEVDFLSPNNQNEDLVHIPFLRMLARNDLDEVISSAKDFVEQFPESPIGYLYLVKALTMLGREEEAFTIIVNSTLSREALFQIQARLEKLEGENAKYYWRMLKF